MAKLAHLKSGLGRFLYINAVALLGIAVSSGQPVFAAKKAFVFGIANYVNPSIPKLLGPASDAAAMQGALIKLGYNVTQVEDDKLDRNDLFAAWGDFVNSINPNDEVVVYYSGHGVEVDGTNYIIPIDMPNPASITSTPQLRSVLISLTGMYTDITNTGAAVVVFILDACRNDPFPTMTKAIGNHGGINPSSPFPTGMAVFYAASLGQTAFDLFPTVACTPLNSPVCPAANSLFTRLLLVELPKDATSGTQDLAKDVQVKVVDLSNKAQTPGYYDQIGIYYCLGQCKPTAPSEASIETQAGGVTLTADSLAAAQQQVAPHYQGFAGGVDVAWSQAQTAAFASAVNNGIIFNAKLKDDKEIKDKAIAAVDSNAVFLGSTDDASCSGGSADGKYPFGCDVLKTAILQEPGSLVGRLFDVVSPVSVRRTVPLLESGDITSSCVVERLTKGSSVTFNGIVVRTQKRAEPGGAPEKLYYATIDGPARECLTR
jgi:hypothetical protein